jgi:hypothetical protein
MTKLNKETFFGRIIEKGTFRLYYSIDETVYPENSFILAADNSTGGFTYYYPGTVKTNNWQHLAISVSGNVYKFYIDGVEQTPQLYNGQPSLPNSNAGQYLFIGNRGNLNRPVDGFIDEFRLWNTVLTQTQIQSRMYTNINVGAADSNLVAYYKFIEGAGSYVYDYSRNDNTAFILNADVNGNGEGKFWNAPGNLMEDFKILGQQYPTTFNANTNTFNVVMRNANLSNLVAQFSAVAGSTVKIGSVTQSNGVTANNFTSPITYTLNGVGFNVGINQTYTAVVTNEILKDSACDLTAFWFEPTENPGKPQINMVKNGSNFDKKMMGLDASAMRAKFTIPATAKLYLDDVIQTNPQATVANYTKPVMVKVVAEDGKNMNMYAINLDVRSNVATLSSFGIPSTQVGLTKTDSVAKTIQVIVKPNANLDMQTPSFTQATNANVYVNGIAQFSGISSNNYNSPVAYKVVSEDETVMVDWMVTVSKQVLVNAITLSGAGGSTAISTKGGTLQITAAILPNTASFKDVTWSIVNGTGLGSISSTGLITASKDGTVTVKAKANDSSNIEGTLLITISNQTVGLSQNLNTPIKVYPNPATNNLYVENPNGDNLALVVYDLLGGKILEKSTNELMNSLDISSLKNGLYFIQISNSKNESTTVKIVKE